MNFDGKWNADVFFACKFLSDKPMEMMNSRRLSDAVPAAILNSHRPSWDGQQYSTKGEMIYILNLIH